MQNCSYQATGELTCTQNSVAAYAGKQGPTSLCASVEQFTASNAPPTSSSTKCQYNKDCSNDPKYPNCGVTGYCHK